MITLEVATAALEAWNIQPDGSLEEIHQGRVFKVNQRLSKGFILKDVSEYSIERLLFDFSVIEHLARSGIPVAVPLRTDNDRRIVEIQGMMFTLSPCLIADDDPGPGDWEKRIPSYGETFARLHLALATYPSDGLEKKTWSNNPIKETFESCIPNLLSLLNKSQSAKLSEIANSIELEMREALGNLPIQLIHRDLHDGNIVVSGDKVVGIIDCDHFSLGTPMIDIAYFLHHTVKWLGKADDTMAKNEDRIKWWLPNEDDKKWWLSWVPDLIRVYKQIRQPNEREISSLPYLMVWTILMFANTYCRQGNNEQTQLYLNLLDFVYVNRHEIKSAINNSPDSHVV